MPGDGIGPEVTAAGHRVLKEIAQRFKHSFEFEVCQIGGAAIDSSGSPLPDDIIASCERCNAGLPGVVGGTKWTDPNATVRSEQGLLGLRTLLCVYANLRAVKFIAELAEASPITTELWWGSDLSEVG